MLETGAKESMNNQTETLSSKSKRELKHLKEEVGSKLRVFPDFPKPGIRFMDRKDFRTKASKTSYRSQYRKLDLRDVMVLMRYPLLLEELYAAIAEHARVEIPVTIDAVAGLEARGFLFGPQIAMILKVPFVPIRKKGKLPGKTYKEVYQKEYGEDVIEVQEDAIKQGSKVLLVDDLLATGGSLKAAASLVEKAGGDVAEAFTLIELAYLKPREHMPEHIPVYSLITLTE
ncbi:Adenine phosphoribosyltransferase [Dirofilaria immitis]